MTKCHHHNSIKFNPDLLRMWRLLAADRVANIINGWFLVALLRFCWIDVLNVKPKTTRVRESSFRPFFSNGCKILARLLWTERKWRTVGYTCYSVTLSLARVRADIHSVRTYTTGLTYLVVYSDDAGQEFAIDKVVSLNESNSSISFWIRHRPLSICTDWQPHATNYTILLLPVIAGFDAGLATQLHKR